LEHGTPALPPGIDLGLVSMDRSALPVSMAVDRQAFVFLPQLNRPNFTLQIRGNVLPGIQPVLGLNIGRWGLRRGLHPILSHECRLL
jgi:hypothetical protein